MGLELGGKEWERWITVTGGKGKVQDILRLGLGIKGETDDWKMIGREAKRGGSRNQKEGKIPGKANESKGGGSVRDTLIRTHRQSPRG